jgi:hypothetical protein
VRALWICQPRRDELLWSLQDRWAQGQAGRGHIVVLSGEASNASTRNGGERASPTPHWTAMGSAAARARPWVMGGVGARLGAPRP